MIEAMFQQFMDRFWLNLRNAMIAGGTTLIVNGTKGFVSPENALALMTPLADIIIGFLVAGVAWLWGNFVEWRTVAVPEQVATELQLPTVSPATGAVQQKPK